MTHDATFEELLNTFLSSFSPQFSGGFKLNKKNLLIIPDENKKLINCMKKEDKEDDYYNGDLSAVNIKNPDIIYQNYLYGIMINISSAANSYALNNVFEYCLTELLNEKSLDKQRGGWIHYRLPWITARILLGLHNILSNNRIILSNRNLYKEIDNQDRIALDSLIERIYNDQYWRSGAGNWVSMWESTGLCLEAFITSNKFLTSDYYLININKVIDYLFRPNVVKEWLPKEIDFSNEESTNNLLAKVVLCSVLFRYIKLDNWKKYIGYKNEIQEFFVKCVENICENKNITARQYCTIPQILLYIAVAVKE